MATLRSVPGSYCGPSAVDNEGLPGYVAGGCGGEEEQRAVELVGLRVRPSSVRSRMDCAKAGSARNPVSSVGK